MGRVIAPFPPAAKCLQGQVVIGVDEAGRGPLAGPVVAAACVLGAVVPDGLDDSKRLSARRRAALEPLIRQHSLCAIGVAEADEIDRINILAATMQAMTRAVAALVAQLDGAEVLVLIDGNLTPHGRAADWCWPARALVGGDGLEPCISAASILAKEHRDRVMRAAAQQFPHYGWDRNMGYGTAQHLEALRRHGPCALHRFSFAPVAQRALFA